MLLNDYLKEIENFVVDYLKNNHGDCYVLGLSGGVDSSMLAGLVRNALDKSKLLCLILPIESDSKDTLDAIKVAKFLDVNYKVIDLTDVYRIMVKDIEESLGEDLSKGSRSNLKVRLRMSTLYAYAQNHNGFVLGTDNMDERYTGYFTKYGDGAADLLPIVYLTKAEVIKAAKHYGVSNELANRVPSAGLFEGQTDEGEMGITYKDLDSYLLGNKVPEV